MTRLGIVAAVIIIVVASIFFGFRKAAREHAATEAATRSAGSPARIRQIDSRTRQILLERLASARAKRSPDRQLAADYVRDQVRALSPLLSQCHADAVTFAIIAEPEIGGIVDEIDAPSECVRQTLIAAQFPAPRDGGRAVARYPDDK